MTRIRTILVGTDGSDTARSAVRHAADMASKTGAVLHIVLAYNEPSVQSFMPRGQRSRKNSVGQ
jgi:nucleotide-binding universal stress UspA family protein